MICFYNNEKLLYWTTGWYICEGKDRLANIQWVFFQHFATKESQEFSLLIRKSCQHLPTESAL